MREKEKKTRKTWTMTKKRSSEILAVKIFRPPKLGARSPPLFNRYRKHIKRDFSEYNCNYNGNQLDTYPPTCLMYSTGCPSSNGSCSLFLPWSGGVSWVLLRP